MIGGILPAKLSFVRDDCGNERDGPRTNRQKLRKTESFLITAFLVAEIEWKLLLTRIDGARESSALVDAA
jgi:hypothetical protein